MGTALALRFADAGDGVRVVTRSGRGPSHPSVERVAMDAGDGVALAAVAAGAATIHNCANPGSYEHWEAEWPPLASAILYAAEQSGAVLVTMSNLYAYGPPEKPMTRQTPLRPSDHKGALRARMWEEARAAHEAGRVRATEARASDYIGPTVTTAGGLIARYAAATLGGRPAWVFADPDQPHSWAFVDDVAETLATLGDDERAWGTPWIVPTAPPRSVRQVLHDLGERVDGPAGGAEPRLRTVPRWMLRAGGVAVPLLRELTGVLYQFDAPFVSDGAETTAVLGVAATPWSAVLDATAPAWAQRASTSP